MKTFTKKAMTTVLLLLAVTIGAYAQTTWTAGSTQNYTNGYNETNNVTMAGDVTVNVPSGATATISGTITGNSHKLTKTGAGTLIFNNAGMHTGLINIAVEGGTLQVGTGGETGGIQQNSASYQISVSNGATLIFNRSGSGGFERLTNLGTFIKRGTGGCTLGTFGGDCSSTSTTVENGVLRIGNNSSTAGISAFLGNITVNAGATVYFSNYDDYTFTNVISGGGNVIQAGSGVLTFSGANTYTGATTVSAGQLNIAAGGGSILQTSGINLSASTASVKFNNTTERDYTMPITGSGSLIKDGTGKLNLTGTLSYTGATTISDGTLSIRNTLASSSVTNNGNFFDLTINEGETLSYNGIISGGGALVKWGTGSLILTAANMYIGATTVDNGILQLGNGGTTGTITNTSSVEVRTAGELVFYHSETKTFSKVISGAGKVTKKGSNILKFTADNTYTGITTIEAGTLNIGGWTTAGSVAGNIVNNGHLTFERNNAYTYNGIISGSGNVESYGTALTLNGANTYTGETQITYTLASIILGANGTIEQSSGVRFTEAGKFNISAASKKLKNLNGSVTGAEVVLGTRTLTLGNTNEADGGGAYSGKFLGTATASTIAISKSGTGTLTLTGASTYSGITRINQGVVEFSALANFGTSTIDLYRSPKTLRWLSGNTADISSRITAISDYAGATTTFDVGYNNVTFATALPAGTSVINKTGGGSLYLTANNTRTGQLNIQQGYLYISGTNGAYAGDIYIHTILFFDKTNPHTYAGVISGDGSVYTYGSSTVTLTGNNTFTGTLGVSGSDVVVGNGATLGSIATQNISVYYSKSLTFNRSDDIIYSGVISEEGNIIHQGAGKLTLNGVNTYTGATLINNGTLELGANGKIENSVAVMLVGTGKFRITSNKTIGALLTGTGTEVKLDGGTLMLNDTTTQITQEPIDGIITGTGGISKYGTLQIIFNGANTYSGETRIISGTLKLGASGTIANSDVLLDDMGKLDVSAGNKVLKSLSSIEPSNEVMLGATTLQIGTSTASNDGGGYFEGFFSGTGGQVMKAGTQRFDLYGTNTATGKFTHASGSLFMGNNAVWAGDFDLYSGATLDIIGTVNVSGAFAKVGGGNSNITMNLIGSNPSKLNIGGAFSAAGTGTFNISANAGNNQVLMEAASGLLVASQFNLNMPGFNATLATGTNGARQTLLLNATITDNTAPTIGSALAAGTATAVIVPLTWGAATDNQTAAANLRYFVYRSLTNNIANVANCEANGTLLNTGGTVGVTNYFAAGLTPNTQYYFNVVVQDQAGNKAAYASVNKTTLKADLSGTVSITGSAVFGQTLTAVTTGLSSTPSVTLGALTYQWKRGATNIGTNSATYTLVQADINSTITVIVTAANTLGNVVSAATASVTKATQATPAPPTLASKTHNSVTLNAIAGCEYSEYNGGVPVWQDNVAFTGLLPNTTYYFYARMKETATHFASLESSATTITTDVAPAITTFEINPSSISVQKGSTQQFTANVVAVGGASTAVTWSIVGTHHANTTISTSGLLTIAAAETANSLQVKITSQFESALTATAQVTLTAAPAVTNVSVSADASEVMKGQTLQFSANVTAAGGASEAVTWTIVGTHHASTTVSTSGLLSVATAETVTTLTVKATSQFNTAVAGQLTVNVLDIPAVTNVSVTPSPVSVQKGNSQNFTANVIAVGGASTAVTWSIVGTHHASTSISTSGVLSVAAAETATSLQVKATSDFNSAVSGTATVTITDTPVTPEVLSVTVSPSNISLEQGQNTTFSANVEAVGGASEAVTWSIVGTHHANTTISTSGSLSIAAAETATSLQVKATSNFNTSKFGTANVTITSIPATPEIISVDVEPMYIEMSAGENYIFSANVNAVGGADETVTWSVIGNASPNTTIDASGYLILDESEPQATLKVRATSVFDPAKFGEATITVKSKTGIETLYSLGVNIWVENSCNLRIENYEVLGNTSITIYNTVGQTIYHSRLTSNSINISDWTNGVYLVKIGKYVEKIVKK